MLTIPELNRAWAAGFDLATMPFIFPHLVYMSICFSVLEVAAEQITKRANEELNRRH